jgi:hypothetical protein
MRTLAGTMQRIDCRRRASERTWGAIDRDGVRRLAEEGAQLVDALPAADYAEGRLPGAISGR